MVAMVSHIKSIGLNLCGVLFALSAAHATDSELMLKDTASNAIYEFKMTGDIAPIWRTTGKLAGQPSGAVLSVCPDILNALYEVADPAFDVDRAPSPRRNISPGGPYPAGIDPEAIKDPKLKAEYQQRLADNREYGEYYRQQYWISRAINEVARLLRQSFGEGGLTEVSSLLVSSGMKASYSDDFLKRMETQVP